MHTQQNLESLLVNHLIFKNVSLHLSLTEITTIKASRLLSTEWKDEADLTLAHRLYWAEFDWELAVSSALHEARLMQQQDSIGERGKRHIDSHLFD